MNVAAHPPCGQSTNNKPGSSSGQATPHLLPLSSKQLKMKPNYIKDEIHILESLQYLHSPGNNAEQSAHHELYKRQPAQPHDKLSVEKKHIWCVLL